MGVNTVERRAFQPTRALILVGTMNPEEGSPPQLLDRFALSVDRRHRDARERVTIMGVTFR